MQSMFSYSKAAVERAMKVQEVILRAMAKKITWWQAAEIIGVSDRQMRRWHERYRHRADHVVRQFVEQQFIDLRLVRHVVVSHVDYEIHGLPGHEFQFRTPYSCT